MSRGLSMAALAWSIPGFAIQAYSLYKGLPLPAMGGTVLLIAGLMCYSKAKGYTPAWGLWGLVPVMGPVLVLLQPARAEVTSEETIDRLLLDENPRFSTGTRHGADAMRGGWPLLAMMTPLGVLLVLFCGGFPRTPSSGVETEPVPEVAAPDTSHVAAPDVPGPNPEPVAAAATPVPEPEPEKERSGEDKYADLKPGMSYEEVCAITGSDMTLISGAIGGDAIIKWRNTDKSYFAVRFRDGRLDRLTRLMEPPLEKKNEEMARELEAAIVYTLVSKAQGAQSSSATSSRAELPGLAEAEAAARGETAATPVAKNDASTGDTPQETAAKTRKAVVRIGENTKPPPREHKARLPKYSQKIAPGPHDVHILNPYDTSVKVGLRGAGKRGKDISIPANSEDTFYLPNGEYSLYFIAEDQPLELNNAGSFVVDSPPDAIVINLH